ncbi:MAG: hypothetical protein JW717_14415 [Marinilabiliaceae bacterium]|nr:hypothetical protein [Marinilabiliaceae bacterium]
MKNKIESVKKFQKKIKDVYGIFYFFESFMKNKNVLLFVFFLLLSTTFWLLNSLRKNYVTTVSCPIHFENLPDDKLISGDMSEKLKIKIRGNGFILLSYKLSGKLNSIPVNFKYMRRFSNGHTKGAFLLAENLESLISSELNKDIELLEIDPDTIVVGLQNRKKRMVPVLLNADLSYQGSYLQSGKIIIDPGIIEVAGPENFIDTLKNIKTEMLTLQGISDSVFLVVNLIVPSWCEIKQSKVSITIPVESYTESRFRIPISVSGLPQNYSIKTFPSEIDLSCLVAIGQFERVKPDNFTAEVDLTGVDISSQQRLKVKIIASPEFVYSVKYEPIFVDFLIEKLN